MPCPARAAQAASSQAAFEQQLTEPYDNSAYVLNYNKPVENSEVYVQAPLGSWDPAGLVECSVNCCRHNR
eukprot:3557284-Lingulodinium_polyedra.AAC.1